MAYLTLTVETTVRRKYRDRHDGVKAETVDPKPLTLCCELGGAERARECVEGEEHKVIRPLWAEVEATEEFEEYGFQTYVEGEITVHGAPEYWRNAAEHASDEEDADAVGVLWDWYRSERTGDGITRALAEALTDHGHDLSYWRARGSKRQDGGEVE